MKKPRSKFAYLFGGLVALTGGILFIFVFGIGWLFFAPVSLSIVAPYFVQEFERAYPSFELSIKSPRLIMIGTARNFGIQIEHISLVRSDGLTLDLRNILLVPSREGFLLGDQIVPQYLVMERLDVVVPPPIIDVAAIATQPASPLAQRKDLPKLDEEEALALLFSVFQDVGQSTAAQNGFEAKYIDYVAIPYITIRREVDAHASDIAARPVSSFYVERSGEINLRLDIALHYQLADRASTFIANGRFTQSETGYLDVSLNNIDTQDLAHFNLAFRPFVGIQLPLSGTMEIITTDNARLQEGQFNLELEPGQVELGGVRFGVDKLKLDLFADFIAREIFITQADFDVANSRGNFAGNVTYDVDASGALRYLVSNISGSGVEIDIENFFAAPIVAQNVNLNLEYDPTQSNLTIGQLFIEVNEARLQFSGDIDFTTGEPDFNLRGTLSPMAYEQALALWPVTGGRRAREWVVKNLSGGDILGGDLRLTGLLSKFQNGRTSGLVDEDFTLDLGFENVVIRFLEGIPPIERTRGRMRIGARRYQAWLDAGEIIVDTPDGAQNLDAGNTWFRTFDYFSGPRDATTQVTLAGRSAAILRLIDLPPLSLLSKVPFERELITGDMVGEALLSFPLRNTVTVSEVDFKVKMQSDDFGTNEPLNGFQFSEGQVRGLVTTESLEIFGPLRMNGVPLQGAWHQEFKSKDALSPQAKIALSGQIQASDLEALKQERFAPHVEGSAWLNLLVEGNLRHLDKYRMRIDMEDTHIAPLFLNHVKEVGVGARIDAKLTLDKQFALETLKFDYMSGDDIVRADIGTDENGVITRFAMDKFKLGDNYDLTFHLKPDAMGRRKFVLRGERGDISRLSQVFPRSPRTETQNDAGILDDLIDEDATAAFRTLEPVSVPRSAAVPGVAVEPTLSGGTIAAGVTFDLDVLGDDYLFDMLVDRLVGRENTALNYATIAFDYTNAQVESLIIDGRFADGSKLTGELERVSPSKRKFFLNTIHAGDFFRLIGLLEGVYGGALNVSADVVDGRGIDISGQASVSDFDLRNLPVLLRILSIASFTGIASAFQNEGIRFDRARMNFEWRNSRIDIKNGVMSGEALGVILNGAFDYTSQKLDFDGTLIPAYSLNSIFSRVPIIGTLLGNRKDEGLIGITFRLGGAFDAIEIGANPLSVVTIGLLRRLFTLRRKFLLPDDGTPAFGGESDDIYDYDYD